MDRRFNRRLAKKEFFCVQVRDIEILKPDRAAAVHREVDYGVVPSVKSLTVSLP